MHVINVIGAGITEPGPPSHPRGGAWPQKKRRCQGSGLRGMTNPSYGQVVVALAGEDMSALLWRLPERPVTAGLVTELNLFVELAKESQRKEIIMEAYWTLGGQGKDPRQRRISRLLTEAGEEEPERRSEEHRGEGGGGN